MALNVYATAVAPSWAIVFAGVLLFHCSATPAPSPTPDASVAADAGPDAREPPTRDGSAAGCGIPAGVTLDEQPRCTTTSPGLFTEYIVSVTAGAYHVEACNVEESELPRDQEDFDRREVRGAPFLKSNGDFVRTPDCISASITADGRVVSRFVWVRMK
jgi:hypothetical protein